MSASDKLQLSVVVPAFNEEDRLSPTLLRIGEYLDARQLRYELIVVDDGSSDRTVATAEALRESIPALRIIELGENRGKGAAVRAGMVETAGERVLFSDADLAAPIEELSKLESALNRGADIAIGSRGLRESDIRVRQKFMREYMGRTFNLIVRAVALSGIHDTQCGFKLFDGEAARDLFSRMTVEGFAFDVEILVLARGRYRVEEVPIAWRHVEESKVSPGSDALRMLRDVLVISGRRVRDKVLKK